jgi:hypothetical protein
LTLNPKFVNQRVEVLLHEISVFLAEDTLLLRLILEASGGTAPQELIPPAGEATKYPDPVVQKNTQDPRDKAKVI